MRRLSVRGRFSFPGVLLVPMLAQAATGGAPLKLQHSGYLLTDTDVPLSGSASLRFRVYDAPAAGSLEWEGNCNNVAVRNGVFAVQLGGQECPGVAGAGDSTLDTNDVPPNATRWLEMQVNGVWLAPRLMLAPVPLAVLAQRALDTDLFAGRPVSDFSLVGHTHDAVTLTGTLPDARLSANVATLAGAQTFTGVKTFSDLVVTGTLSAASFSGSGAALTGLSASNLGAGTLPDARLSANVATLAGAQTFTGVKTFQGLVTTSSLTVGNDAAACTASNAGSIRFTGTNFQGCVGGAWTNFDNVPSPIISSVSPTSAPTSGGITLTLTGSNFQSGATVTVGGTTASIVSLTSTQIVVTVPASTSIGARDVKIVNSDLQSHTLSGGLTYWAAGDTAATAATSCNALRTKGITTDGTYWINPTGGTAYQNTCDMTTDGGGWTLVASLGNDSTWAVGNAIWHDATTGLGTPTLATTGKSKAYGELAGTALLFRTHGGADGRWASFNMPSSSTLLGLVGTTNPASLNNSEAYVATVTRKAQGSAAHACWNQDWRVTWRHYGSADDYADSAIFAPSSLSSSVRPCGGSTSYATGIGVRTDTRVNSGGGYASDWAGYGGSVEGVGSDGSGNFALTGGNAALYVR